MRTGYTFFHDFVVKCFLRLKLFVKLIPVWDGEISIYFYIGSTLVIIDELIDSVWVKCTIWNAYKKWTISVFRARKWRLGEYRISKSPWFWWPVGSLRPCASTAFRLFSVAVPSEYRKIISLNVSNFGSIFYGFKLISGPPLRFQQSLSHIFGGFIVSTTRKFYFWG